MCADALMTGQGSSPVRLATPMLHVSGLAPEVHMKHFSLSSGMTTMRGVFYPRGHIVLMFPTEQDWATPGAVPSSFATSATR